MGMIAGELVSNLYFIVLLNDLLFSATHTADRMQFEIVTETTKMLLAQLGSFQEIFHSSGMSIVFVPRKSWMMLAFHVAVVKQEMVFP